MQKKLKSRQKKLPERLRMIKIERMSKYTPKLAEEMRGLLIELSRSGKDKGEIPREWFKQVISSPWHDVLLAKEDEQLIGMASLSIIMGAGIRQNAYLEDFVVGKVARGKGVGGMLWEEMLKWAKEKGCMRLEFTCGDGREVAQGFYLAHGAEIYKTNFFRKKIED